MRRQHLHAVALAGKDQIADIFTGAGGKTLIFNAPDSLSDAEFCHGHAPLFELLARLPPIGSCRELLHAQNPPSTMSAVPLV